MKPQDKLKEIRERFVNKMGLVYTSQKEIEWIQKEEYRHLLYTMLYVARCY